MAHIHIKFINLHLSVISYPKILDEKLRVHGHNLACLMGLTHLQEHSTIAYENGYFQKGAISLINDAVKEMLDRIRPQFISLIELVPTSDNMLMSAIGNSYGDIYETHLEWAKNSRLNQRPGAIQDGFMENMMPILQGKL